MEWTVVKTKKELTAALAKDGGAIEIAAAGLHIVVTTGRWTFRAAIGFRASVEAWGNSSVVAWGNSSVVARGNSSVVAWGNVFVRLFGALKVAASAHVAIMLHGTAKTLSGGRQMVANKPATPQEWCEHYGVEIADGVATLFKAVDDDFSTARARPKGIVYAPGAVPVAPDWDDGVAECGNGLHFSPAPPMALEFNSSAKHFVACPVRLTDMSVHADGDYPQKVKAKGCCAPVWEVDRSGKRIDSPVKAV